MTTTGNITVAGDVIGNSGIFCSPGTARTTAAYGLNFYNDVTLYRSAANTLKTDDSFVAAGAIVSSSYMDAASYIDAAGGFRKNGTAGLYLCCPDNAALQRNQVGWSVLVIIYRPP